MKSAIEFGEFKARLTDIEKLHYNRLENLLLNSAIFTLDTQHALVWALECIEELYERNQENKGE